MGFVVNMKKIERGEIKMKPLVKKLVLLISISILVVFITACGSLAEKANKIETDEGWRPQTVILEKDVETVDNLRDEFLELYDKGDYGEIVELLNEVDDNHIGILLHDTIADADTDKGTVEAYVSEPEKYLDMLITIGWDKLDWNEERYQSFSEILVSNTGYVFKATDVNPLNKRFEIITEYDNFSKLPVELQEFIKFDDTEFSTFKRIWEEKCEDDAVKNAETVLKYQLKDPNSLQIINTSSEYREDGKVDVVLYYSATNSFGGRVSNVYRFTDKGDSSSKTPDDYKEEILRK